MQDSDLTCLSKGSKGHSLLVFALRQQRYGHVTADLLQLVGTLGGLADGHENTPHPPPVLQLGAKLSKKETRQVEGADASSQTEPSSLRQEPTSISTTTRATFRYP